MLFQLFSFFYSKGRRKIKSVLLSNRLAVVTILLTLIGKSLSTAGFSTKLAKTKSPD